MSNNDDNILYFLLRDNIIKFFRGEFALITSLIVGHYSDKVYGSYRLKEQYFDNRDLKIGDLDVIYNPFNFNMIDNINAVKLSLYYFFERQLFGKRSHYNIDNWLLYIVDDLNEFNKHLGGSAVYQYLYKSLSYVLVGKANKYKKKIDALKGKGKKYKAGYDLFGFVIEFLVGLAEL